ncbi:DUF937 domain-containing protein [Mangrovimonas sp. CR14]|uniref:DUF937 domain-containing protein n=1 Tax=Mangrovimonas sp. CR14 TaxID=2706120 RepID=UPI00141DDBFC|nr:DUF937 domain-containing protein [Mangrovimonas sp. CR14]NIK91774.1 DUF937 domain-containing protein [Mangrovimonas sp. CR14]
MSGILDILNSDLGQSIISGAANQTNQPQDKTASVLTMALPVMMQAMKRNASSPEGAANLLGALNNSKHDGSLLDNLGGFFEGGVNDNMLEDGSKILNHVLGSKQQGVNKLIGDKSGMDANQVAEILKVAAPILLGLLGKQTRQNNVSSADGLDDLLGGMIKGNSGDNEQSFLEAILDADGDGSVVDDVAGMVLGSSKNKGGLGGLLGGLFGK